MQKEELLARYPGLAGFEGRLSTANEAVSVIKAGNQIFIGSACATPQKLVAAIENINPSLPDVPLLYFITQGAVSHDNDKPLTNYRHKFFVGSDSRRAAALGIADYIPISLTQVPQLFENRRIPIDVAMVQVTPPDAFGNACYFLNPSTNLGEVAYMILPEWQGTGLGSAMQACLIEHAKSQNIQGFVAEILTDKKNGQTCQARLR